MCPKALLTILLVLASLPALTPVAQAQTGGTVTGTGVISAASPPDCDEGSIASAEKAADDDATRQCQGQSTDRLGDYAVTCRVLVHGYAAVVEVSALYQCRSPLEENLSLPEPSPINVIGQGTRDGSAYDFPTGALTRDAEESADQDAQSRCILSSASTTYVKRIGEYKILEQVCGGSSCHVAVDATYECIAPVAYTGPREVIGAGEIDQDCDLQADIPGLLGTTEDAALADARAKCGSPAVTRISDFVERHGCTPLNSNYDRNLVVTSSAVFMCTLEHNN